MAGLVSLGSVSVILTQAEGGPATVVVVSTIEEGQAVAKEWVDSGRAVSSAVAYPGGKIWVYGPAGSAETENEHVDAEEATENGDNLTEEQFRWWAAGRFREWSSQAESMGFSGRLEALACDLGYSVSAYPEYAIDENHWMVRYGKLHDVDVMACYEEGIKEWERERSVEGQPATNSP